MSTAIIVSGSVRSMVNAATSWKFKGDYHLTIDRLSYRPQFAEVLADNVKDLKSIIDDLPIKFTSATICLNPGELGIHGNTFNMAWKWKCAYHNLVPYHSISHYDKVLILRPDLWVRPSTDLINDITVEDNAIYTTSKLYSVENDERPRANDLFLLMTMTTFEKLSYFYDFYIKQDLSTSNIHTLLAEYMIENKIEAKDDLINLYDVCVLRETTDHLFENGLLKEQYSFVDITEANRKWWDEKFK